MYTPIITTEKIQSMRSAFSQLELVFVIVIVGILAAVAIPKLAGTANAAKLAIDTSNMGVCIRETSTYYALYRNRIPEGYTTSCDNIKCYTITTNDINFTVETNSTAENYCADVENVGGHLAKRYDFGGNTIKR